MKKLLLLLLVYANMGFIAPGKKFQIPGSDQSKKPASAAEGGGLIVSSPEDCRVLMQ